MNPDQAKKLGAVIRKHRDEAGLSLRKMEELTGIDDSLLTRMEQGVILTPSPDKLSRIAEALDIPLADLYALADYAVPSELPSVGPYLRTKYRNLPTAAIDEVQAQVAQLLKQHGIEPSDGPKNGEDEQPEDARPET